MKTLILICHMVTTHVGVNAQGAHVYAPRPQCEVVKRLPVANIYWARKMARVCGGKGIKKGDCRG